LDILFRHPWHEHPNTAYYTSWEQSSDIRGDWTTGWGGGGGLGLGLHGLAVADARDSQYNEGDQWGWRLQNSAVHPVPDFYPMDSRCTRRIDLSEKRDPEYQLEGSNSNESTNALIEDISYRISTACQRLSIHGVWDNFSPSATLCSMELVEIEINIYLGESDAGGGLLDFQSSFFLNVFFFFLSPLLLLYRRLHIIKHPLKSSWSKSKGARVVPSHSTTTAAGCSTPPRGHLIPNPSTRPTGWTNRSGGTDAISPGRHFHLIVYRILGQDRVSQGLLWPKSRLRVVGRVS